MPRQKKNTTLVTEDELVEAVSARVTDQIRQDMNERFGRIDQVLDKLTAPREDPPLRVLDQANKRPAQQTGELEQPVEKAPHQDIEVVDRANSHSSSGTLSATHQEFPTRPAQPVDMTYRHAHAPGLQELRATSGVNINNNNPAWNTWHAQQHHANSCPSTASAHQMFDAPPFTAGDIDAQVRHIMDTTPHQLKGNVPVGIFPFKKVTRGPEKKKLSFNMVTLPEHIYGMFRIIDDESVNPAIKPDIITHMREVAEDACEFERNGYVRRWSEEVFSLIAEDRLPGGWAATARIQNLRTGMSRVDAARLVAPRDVAHPNRDASHSKRPATQTYHPDTVLRGGPPCAAFNSPQGCTSQSGHMLNGKKQIHVCSYCLLNNAAAHSEAMCRNKQRHSASHFQ